MLQVKSIFRLLYYYMRNFCNLIGLELWYFNFILKYLHVKITNFFIRLFLYNQGSKMKEIENQPTISDKNLQTLWKILLLLVYPHLPFAMLLQPCNFTITSQHCRGKGVCIGVSRIFGEDCGFKNFNLNLILTCNISLITLLVFVTGAVAVVFF